MTSCVVDSRKSATSCRKTKNLCMKMHIDNATHFKLCAGTREQEFSGKSGRAANGAGMRGFGAVSVWGITCSMGRQRPRDSSSERDPRGTYSKTRACGRLHLVQLSIIARASGASSQGSCRCATAASAAGKSVNEQTRERCLCEQRGA